MKRFILVAAAVLTIGAVKASQQDDFFKKEENRKTVGGIFGFGGTSVLDEEKTKRFFESLTSSLENAGAVQNALKKQQDENQSQSEEIQRLKRELELSKTQEKFLRVQEEKLLIDLDTKDSTVLLQKERNVLLEKENKELKELIEKIKENEKEISKLLSDISKQEELKDPELETLLTHNKRRLEIVQQEMKELGVKKEETEKKIKSLEKRIAENDHYTHIKIMIEHPSVSDDELSLKIYSICNFFNTDLDSLSTGRRRLIEILIMVSKPTEGLLKSDERWEKYYGNNGMFTKGFRLLGNLFTPSGLGYGEPLDWNDTKHKGSKFEQKSKELGKIAKDTFNK